jgi:hypothetical protein
MASNKTTPRNSVDIDIAPLYSHYFAASGVPSITVPVSFTLTDAQSFIDGTVIRYQLAVPIDTLNVPFKNPWTDLKGTADCTLVNFAGTTADGYTVETINGKTNTFLNLDGLNSFGQFADMDVLNPVGTDDFCQMVVFRPDDLASRFWGVTRNTASITTVQYGLYTVIDGRLFFRFASAVATQILPSYSLNLQYVLYGRINGRRFAIHNGNSLIDSISDGLIASESNTQLCCISLSTDGLTKTQLAKGLQGDIAFWKGAQGTLDKDKIVDLVKRAMKSKYGLGI